jgi:hypothetical protein
MTEARTDSPASLFQRWNDFGARLTWQGLAERAADPAVARGMLAGLPEVSALDALSANARLVELLIGQRWYVMQAAREAGASWAEIGAALGMSKQGAQDWYRRKVADQAKYAPEFHDDERAAAVVDDGH